jgi:hypothetical protein
MLAEQVHELVSIALAIIALIVVAAIIFDRWK